MTLHATYGASLFVCASLLLAGCGGTRTQPPIGTPFNSAQTGSILPQDRQGCRDENGIKVMPCRITFDMNHSGPKNVRVTTGGRDDRKRGIRERDDCTSRNIATLTRVMASVYTVRPGTARGSCTARFTDGMRNDDRTRGSDLTIANRV